MPTRRGSFLCLGCTHACCKSNRPTGHPALAPVRLLRPDLLRLSVLPFPAHQPTTSRVLSFRAFAAVFDAVSLPNWG